MNPLLTHTVTDPAPRTATSAAPRTAPVPARPPLGVIALQALLLLAAAAAVADWLWSWQGVQAYAWHGVDNGLTERGLAYLLVFAPAVPVNLLAAIWLARGGRRARLYLAGAGALTAVQLVLLLTPAAMPVREAMSDGAAAVGVHFLITVVPIAVAAAAFAATARTRAWLGTEPARPDTRTFRVETVVWALAVLLTTVAGTDVRQWTRAAAELGAPVSDHLETGTWQRLEDAVADTAAALPEFTGFTARTLDVAACGYRTPAGRAAYRYTLVYEFRTADFNAYEAAIATHWAHGDYRLTYNGDTLDGTRRITAVRADGPTLAYLGGDTPALTLTSACVERDDPVPECLPPQGDPPADQVIGITCPD